ncbi:MAG: TonB-dependent receptor plug domain-containing protein [Chitinophagaceae bacterium]|nr:TonB-dependent receptor plug domain-containing protein [Chitinophagaceae bacterium]
MFNNSSKKQQYFITIDEPCHENWDLMIPTETGRFCSNCQKTVIDFSSLSDNEIIKIIERAKGKMLCGQFDTTQLNRIMVETNMQTSNPKLYKILLSLMLLASAGNLSAQETPTPVPQVVQTADPQKTNDSIPLNDGRKKGIVLDERRRNVRLGSVSVHSGNEQPLYVVNGVPVPVSDTNFLKTFNRKEIKNLTVLQGSKATAIYGPQAAAGAILIETYGTKKKRKKKSTIK